MGHSPSLHTQQHRSFQMTTGFLKTPTDISMWLCLHVPEPPGLGWWGQEDSWGFWPGTLDQMDRFRFNEKFCLKNKVESDKRCMRRPGMSREVWL